MTFENFHFLKSMISQVSNNVGKTSHEIPHQNKSVTPSEITSVTQSSKETNCLNFSDLESYITSCNKTKRKNTIPTDIQEQIYPNDFSEPVCINKDDNISKHTRGNNYTSNSSTKEIKSSESFLTSVPFNNKQTNYFSSCKDSYNFKTLRLFNRNGKPLTDRMGRPLLGILGQPLVNIDDEGRLISDAKGNQVFNSLGESAIYSTTNLYIPPSDEEPGIPLLDIDRKHILFLYDNTGHPMTDSLGRPLLKASGNLMFGISPTEKLNLDEYKQYSLKTIYSKAPLENFVRLVQLFDSSFKPLTDEYGKPLRSSTIICNKHGMPMCDVDGHSLFFKHATRVMTIPAINIDPKSKQIEKLTHDSDLKNNKDSFDKPISDSNNIFSLKEYCLAQSKINTNECENDKMFNENDYENKPNNNVENFKSPKVKSSLEVLERGVHHFTDSAADSGCNKKQIVYCNSNSVNNNPTTVEDYKLSCRDVNLSGETSNIRKQDYICAVSHSNKYINFGNESVKHGENSSGEAVVLFDGRKKINNKKSSSNVLAIKDIRNGRIGHSFMKRKPYKNMFRTNFLQYFKNAVNMTNLKYTDDRPIFNDYGKPMKDFYGNLLYDKYGIPLTGADGIKLSEKSRQILRLKLRNIPINKDKTVKGEAIMNAFAYNKSCDHYGDPYYDKHGRPLYDLFGKLIYDIYGRPLTDAFNRPLIDAIGQPLMDSKGNVLTSESKNSKTTTMVDVFGRCLYDKRGRALFDLYGRPRFDIYTNAVYDVCGRPATDGAGVKLYDFLNKTIQPYPEKPLYKNARAQLPKYIDRILTTPSLHLVLKYSHASLKDIFGGPLFDDFGKPLYNKIGKPLYDKYGRPLYDKDGSPLCDRYGRPLSEEIRQSPNDTTVSVVDSLKLLKLTKESSMWMEIKRSQTQALKQTESGVLDDAVIMKINQPTRNKSTQYTYALTRVTTFTCGRQPMYTGQQKSLEQPNFCSSLIDKIWSHKRSPDVRDRGKSPDKKKLKSENNDKSESEKGNKKSEIKSISTKLKKLTGTLPLAVRSNDAYSTGEKSCEVCSMTKEKYKSDLHSAKVVSILVDGVVEKEQAEKMNEEDEPDEPDEGNEKVSKDNGKGDKLSFNLSVYCQGDVIKHNLKCVLIKLQKTLGDLMVQICFVKTRKLGNEEKYKKFNVSISDLKLLKYEYTNLTDVIIPLFKTPTSAKKKSSPEVCVPCVKEKLCEYHTRLGEILKSGRNLRVVMRNDGAKQSSDKCCSRDYPHVHAEVQGKPIVLKYSMPFTVKPSSKSQSPSDVKAQTDPSGRPDPFQKESSGQSEAASENPNSQQEVPYYEWPEDYTNQGKEPEDTSSDPPLVVPREITYPSDSDSLTSQEGESPSKDPADFPEKAPRPKVGFESPKTKPGSDSTESYVSFINSSKSSTSLTSNKSKEKNLPKGESPLSIKPNTTNQIAAPVISNTSLFSKESAKNVNSNPQSKKKLPQKSKKESSSSGDSDSSESKSAQSKNTATSSLYCGCNYDKALKNLGSKPKSQPNSKKIPNEDSSSSRSESSSSIFKADEKNKQFPYKLNNTTAYPVTSTQPSNYMFPQQSSKAYPQNSHKQQNATISGIPSGEEKDNNNIHEHLSKVDSLLIAKERLTQEGEPSRSSLKMTVSKEDRAVAAAFKSFIDEPEYEIRRVVTKDEYCVNPQTNISHQNKKLEMLKHLGKDNLMTVCSPAECCKANNCLDIKDSSTELPLSPSLYSLPLDHSDLEYLAKATGRPISYKDLMLIAEDEVPETNNEWEIQYADNNAQQTPRWLRALGEVDEQKETSGNIPTTQTHSAPRRSSVKSVVMKEEPRLSTIVEEGPYCFSEDERPSIPYMPSIPSLPLDEEEKAELMKKHRPSILKHTTMELRYFTVEIPEKVNNIKKIQQTCAVEGRKLNNNKLCLRGITGNETNKSIKTSILLKPETDKKSCDSFHSCCSSTELMSVNYDQMERKSVSSDELTMLNAIHLCDQSFDYYDNLNILLKSSNTCVQDFHISQNSNVSESKTSYIGCIPEINDCYVKRLILKEDKTQHAGKNKSYTVIKHTDNNKTTCFDYIDDTISQKNVITNATNFENSCPVIRDKNKQSWKPNTTANSSHSSSPASNKTLKANSINNSLMTDLNTLEKITSNSKIISVSETTPKYISVKLNPSYTVVKGSNQHTNSNSSFSYKIDNKPQLSYTVIKNKETEMTNYTTEDVVKQEYIVINDSELENYSLKSQITSLKCKTNNESQNSRHQESNWSKIKLEKSNVKSYVMEQRNKRPKTNMYETKMKNVKDSKRKPLILPRSRLSCRRMQCKVTIPRTHFPNLHPIRINYRIPSIIFQPNKLNKNFEIVEENNELNQQSGDAEQIQTLATLDDKTCKYMPESKPKQTFVTVIENKSNFQDLNSIEAVRRSSSKKNIQKSEFKRTSTDARTTDCYSYNSNCKTQPLESKDSFRFLTVKSNINLKCPQVKEDECKIDEHLLVDHDNHPLYLFDSHGRPLTDQSGRTLRNIKGEFLIAFDKQNNPICDLDNNPICDSLGHILNKKGFNSLKPPLEDVLKSFLRDSGDPILLYDVEGRPLTSVSGTMLVDSSGKCLIRFGCTDKIISDSIGRPIFNSTGEQFNGIS